MKYDYIVANPAGNTTVLVTSKVKKERYTEAAEALRAEVAGAEQVGFLMLPRRGGDYRIETAGAEFCANTLFAAAYYYGKTHGVGSVRMEISGCDEPITVSLEGNKVTADIPLPYYREKSEFSGMDAVDIVFDGIAQTVVYTEEQFPPGKMRFFLISRTSRYHTPAAGLVLVNEKENKLTSAVYAEKIDNLCMESSSADAVAAAAYDISLNNPQDEQLSYAPQQQGGMISAFVKKAENETVALSVTVEIDLAL